ncbi:MAG: energy transducer TonB, partial [Alphaproteobacteria bacterium]|nr:energy transducer TonB [Alphaproteobacteria bacterium]
AATAATAEPAATATPPSPAETVASEIPPPSPEPPTPQGILPAPPIEPTPRVKPRPPPRRVPPRQAAQSAAPAAEPAPPTNPPPQALPEAVAPADNRQHAASTSAAAAGAPNGRAGEGPAGAAGRGQGAAGAGSGTYGAGVEGPGDAYLDAVRRWVARFKHYPKEADRRKQEGRVFVRFTIARDGTVLAAEIVRGSGFPLLDHAALQMLHDASPVPPMPIWYKSDRGTITMPVEFSIGFFDKLFR